MCGIYISSVSVFGYSVAGNKLNTNYRPSGNGAEDIYAVATAQLNKKYPEFAGFNYRVWCADFVSACAVAANVSDVIPGSAAVANLRSNIVRAGGTEYSKSQIQQGKYTPVRGDIIIFKSNGASHVGIVDKTANGRIYYIDGNNTTYGNGNNACVHYSNCTFSYAGFTCVVKPKYKGGSTAHNPEGVIDSIEGGSGSIHLRGWAFDRDALDQSVAIHVYIGGEAGSGHTVWSNGDGVANVERTDVNNVYGVGNNHGYAYTLNVSLTGDYDVYVYAINIGG